MTSQTNEVLNRVETNSWLETYGSDVEIARRRGQLPWKLKKLGLLNEPREVSILDVCCGHGEALDVMYCEGFRNLHGIDLTEDPRLKLDKRFQTVVGDALKNQYSDQSFDVVTCIHAMHHFATLENVTQFIRESFRILKPGGRLYLIDFENSIQIRAAFWFFRNNKFWFNNSYLTNFSHMTIEEWPFLKDYLPQWPQIEHILYDGPFVPFRKSHSLFYLFLGLKKPG